MSEVLDSLAYNAGYTYATVRGHVNTVKGEVSAAYDSISNVLNSNVENRAPKTGGLSRREMIKFGLAGTFLVASQVPIFADDDNFVPDAEMERMNFKPEYLGTMSETLRLEDVSEITNSLIDTNKNDLASKILDRGLSLLARIQRIEQGMEGLELNLNVKFTLNPDARPENQETIMISRETKPIDSKPVRYFVIQSNAPQFHPGNFGNVFDIGDIEIAGDEFMSEKIVGPGNIEKADKYTQMMDRIQAVLSENPSYQLEVKFGTKYYASSREPFDIYSAEMNNLAAQQTITLDLPVIEDDSINKTSKLVAKQPLSIGGVSPRLRVVHNDTGIDVGIYTHNDDLLRVDLAGENPYIYVNLEPWVDKNGDTRIPEGQTKYVDLLRSLYDTNELVRIETLTSGRNGKPDSRLDIRFRPNATPEFIQGFSARFLAWMGIKYSLNTKHIQSYEEVNAYYANKEG